MIGAPIATVLRSIGHTPGTGSPPATPTLSVVNDGDGDAVTATVDGAAGVTNTLYYRKMSATSWTEGNNRAGDGDIAQTGLDDNTWYTFTVVSSVEAGSSLQAASVSLYVTSGSPDSTTDQIWGPIYLLQTLVASSDTFQTWAGAIGENATELTESARAHVHVGAINDVPGQKHWETERDARPFALIGLGEDFDSRELDAERHYTGSGQLMLSFEDNVAAGDADDKAAALQAFAQIVAPIITEMTVLAGSAGYLVAPRFDGVTFGRARPEDEQEGGDYYLADYAIDRGAY